MTGQVFVRMTTNMVGGYTLDVGDVVGLAPTVATRWMAAGIAEPWDTETATSPSLGKPEAAMRSGGRERAVRRGVRARA